MVSLQQKVKELEAERDALAARLKRRQKTRIKAPYTPMSNLEFRNALETLGLSVLAAGEAFAISPRQAQRYASAEHPVPDILAKLVRVVLHQQLTGDDLKAI